MNIKSEDINKINFFKSLPHSFCKKILDKTKINECSSNTVLFKEGERGNTMLLVFQGEVEVTKNMAVKSSSGFTVTTKPIIRLQTSDPKPSEVPISESTVSVVKMPAFGEGSKKNFSAEQIKALVAMIRNFAKQ